MAILLLADHDQGKLKDTTAKALSAAKAMGSDIDILVAGAGAAAAAADAAKLDGVRKVRCAENEALKHQLSEPLAALLVTLASEYDALLSPASTTGKNVMPRVAALVDVMQISDIIKVVAGDTFERPIYAGNAIQTVQSLDAKKIITVRTSAFTATGQGGAAPIEPVTFDAQAGRAQFVREDVAVLARPELNAAKTIISGGRALGSQDKFKELIEPLADSLNAAIGASRAAVDAGYAPNDYQVGQTGKIVAPDLYIAIGISGAIQHLAGMKDSKVIVAINKDGDAPIFQIADYGLVGDLFMLLPELTNEIKKRRAS